MNEYICHASDCDNELTGNQEKWCSVTCRIRELQRAKALAKKIENGAPWECHKCHERKLWKGYQKYCEDCRPKPKGKFRIGPRLKNLDVLDPKSEPVKRATSMADAEAMQTTEGKKK